LSFFRKTVFWDKIPSVHTFSSSLFWFKDEKSEERSVKQKMVEKLREINNFVGDVAFRESFLNFNFPASEDTFQI